MKKLNQTELSLVAKNIHKELCIPVEAEKASMKEKYEQELESSPGRKVIDKLIKDYPEVEKQYGFSGVRSFIVDSHVEKPEYPSCKITTDQIRNELILAQIECGNLETLINTVKSKFE